jgi:hypothetical protein
MNKRNNKFYQDPIDDWIESVMSHPVSAVLFCLVCAIGFYGLIWFMLAAGVMLDL